MFFFQKHNYILFVRKLSDKQWIADGELPQEHFCPLHVFLTYVAVESFSVTVQKCSLFVHLFGNVSCPQNFINNLTCSVTL